MSHCGCDRVTRRVPSAPENDERRPTVFRTPLALALFAAALVAVPAAFAKGGDHRALRIHGTCTQQSTGELKLRREHRRIEVEFEVDQNQNGVPWTVTISRGGAAVTSFTATTRAPSGSFEARRVLRGRLGLDRITVTATSPTGETCTADSAAGTSGARHGGDDGDDDHGGDS
jgi:hypothetical protein